MRQLVFEAAGKLVWHDVPVPRIQADHEVVIETIAATTCEVDRAVIMGMSPYKPPFAIGHESLGRIVDMGEAVSGFQIGDIVSVPYHRTCGTCSACAKHAAIHCDHKTYPNVVPSYGFPHSGEWGGMFSEYYRVPFASHALVRLPDNVDPLAAVSMGDNLSDAWSTTVPHIQHRPGARVLIMSFGGYGLYATQWSLSAGASQVTYMDDDAARLNLAQRLGATALRWEPGLKPFDKFDVLVVARPGADVLEYALLSAAPNAYCSNMVIHFEKVPLPLGAMHMSGVTLRSAYCDTRAFMPEVSSALSRGEINPREIESEIFGPDEAPERLAMPSHKPVVVFDPELLAQR